MCDGVNTIIDDGDKITLFLTPERVRQLDQREIDGMKMIKADDTLFLKPTYYGSFELDQKGVNGWWATRDDILQWLRKNSEALLYDK